jgi:hypothetical protein
MKPVTLFSGTTGLNTVDDPVRIPFDSRTGVGGLAAAVNVTVKRSARIGRRKGYSKIAEGSFHSLYGDRNEAYVVSDRSDDSAIYMIESDFSLRGVRSGLSKGKRVSYTRHPKGRIYYSNGSENGYLWGGKSFIWENDKYYGPRTTREFFSPPKGRHICFGLGRMFIARDNAVYWSEPFREDLYDMARNFWQFGSCVRMVRTVTGGVFVSDEERIYFMNGISIERNCT